MGSAVVGLVGVIVGALLSGSTAFLMARRGEAQQARAAARLLEAELRSVAGNLHLLIASLKVTDNYADLRELLRLPPQTAWDGHKPLLAATLGATEWYAVAAAYESIDTLRAASATDGLFLDEGRRVVHTAIRDLLVDLANNVQAGAAALSRLAGNPHPETESPALREALVNWLRAEDMGSNDDD
jgi:hypothetical protein